LRSGRQVYIKSTPEADNAKTFAPPYLLALDKIALDAPRYQARYLYDSEVLRALRPFGANSDRHPFVVLAGLVE